MKNPLTIDQQIAALLLSVDDDLAAEVLRHFGEDRVEQISRAMRELAEVEVEHDVISDIYRDALGRMREGGIALGDVGAQMETVMVKAFGPERGTEVTQKARQVILERRPFAMFESIDPRDLAELLVEEHPQIAAVFLAHLGHTKAGRVLAAISADRRADLVHRVATLDRTPPEMVQKVVQVMRKKVQSLGLSTVRSDPRAWIKAAAGILNNMGGAEHALLDSIEEASADIAEQIRDEMFTFEDLSLLDGRSMQHILVAVDTKQLALAMKTASKSLEDNVFRNLSTRAGALLAEEREVLGPQPRSDVVDAQQRIVRIVHELSERGDVSLARTAEEVV